MPWTTKIGPNHEITINGVKLTVDRSVKLFIHTSFDQTDIVIKTPSGKSIHIPAKKEPQNETDR